VLMDGLAEIDLASPQERQVILRGLLDHVSLGTTDTGPLAMTLAIRIPRDPDSSTLPHAPQGSITHGGPGPTDVPGPSRSSPPFRPSPSEIW
jgi:hypothetical protein